MDDCSEQFPGCQHNKKQTHYHCIHTDTCDKVYISTSDVQMHFNYHRKDNAIQREGFFRFRGQDDCKTSYCPFQSQNTTHFHCSRPGCQFTFKNKADMEKHKNFHMKDEQLNKDGFKKFMKNDPCGYDDCKFAKVVNHIHCTHSNCDYVPQSSGQILAHRRKHERRDNELAYRKYKLAQCVMESMKNNGEMPSAEEMSKLAASVGLDANGELLDERPASSNGSVASECSTPPPLGLSSDSPLFGKDITASLLPPSFTAGAGVHPNHPLTAAAALLPNHLKPNLGVHPPHHQYAQPLPPTNMFGGAFAHAPHMLGGPGGGSQPLLLSEMVKDRMPDDAWQNYMLRFDNGEGCGFQGCDVEDLQHYHCKDEGCETVFRNEDGVRDHGKNHFIQDQITEVAYLRGDPDEDEVSHCPDSCTEKGGPLHFHCKWVSYWFVSPYVRRRVESVFAPFHCMVPMRKLGHFPSFFPVKIR